MLTDGRNQMITARLFNICVIRRMLGRSDSSYYVGFPPTRPPYDHTLTPQETKSWGLLESGRTTCYPVQSSRHSLLWSHGLHVFGRVGSGIYSYQDSFTLDEPLPIDHRCYGIAHHRRTPW